MRHIGNDSKRIGAISLLAVGLAMTGCKSSGDRTTAQERSDREVANGVKKELARDTMYKYPDVQLVVYDGNVQLTGFVNTPEERLRAAELASYAKGARQIINSIALKPTPTGRPGVRGEPAIAPPIQPDTQLPSSGAAPQPPE